MIFLITKNITILHIFYFRLILFRISNKKGCPKTAFLNKIGLLLFTY